MSNSLRYSISNWDQLTKCRSNNSADLYITVDHVFNDKRLNGTVIRVTHSDFGVLFVCTINASGTILTPENSGIISEFTTDDILRELKKFGFDITFNLEAGLSGDQLDYLMTLDALDFDKIRTLDVYTYDKVSTRIFTQYIVAFNIEKCPKWIKQNYCEDEKSFLEALNAGGAMNLTYISQTKQFDWTWLDYVANIKDIIENNSYSEVE